MNIQATLDECRAELKRQQVEFDAGIIMLHDLASMKDTEQRAIIQAVNHNPARLKVAEEQIDIAATWLGRLGRALTIGPEEERFTGEFCECYSKDHAATAAALLGVEVVE